MLAVVAFVLVVLLVIRMSIDRLDSRISHLERQGITISKTDGSANKSVPPGVGEGGEEDRKGEVGEEDRKGEVREEDRKGDTDGRQEAEPLSIPEEEIHAIEDAVSDEEGPPRSPVSVLEHTSRGGPQPSP